jgi:putative flippase GtrA
MRQLGVLSPQLAVYIFGGLVCAAIDVGLMQLLIVNHVNPFVATTAGFLTSLIVNYVFHAKVTFKNIASAATFTRYLCVVALNYLITLGIVAISISLTGVPLYGKLVSLAVISVNGFLLGKYWIFKQA